MLQMDIEQFLKDLEFLVNMDSGQGNPEGITAVGKYFADRLEAKGWFAEQVDVGPHTGKCTIVKNREAEVYDVLLVGHVDTVFPIGETAKRPFWRDDSRAYGLGTLDMKQGTLAMCCVLEQLPKAVTDKLNIAAIFNPDEEIGSIYSGEILCSYARRAKYAYVFEAASTDGSHCIRRKGRSYYSFRFHGRAGHAGYIFDGVSVSAVNELLYWANGFNSLLSKERGTGVNVGVVRGGQAANIVPEQAEMEVEVRYESPEEYAKLPVLLEKLKRHSTETGVVVECLAAREVPPLCPDEKTLQYAAHVKEICDRNGLDFRTKGRGGVSDANRIAACGCICVDGLGATGDFDHSEKEYLEISSIEPNLRLAYLMLCDLVSEKQ